PRFPYTTLFRSGSCVGIERRREQIDDAPTVRSGASIPIPLAVEFRTQVGGFDVLGFIRPVGRIAWVVGGHSWWECRGGQKPSSQYERRTKGIETFGFEQAALSRRATFGRHNFMNPLDPQPTALAVDDRF